MESCIYPRITSNISAACNVLTGPAQRAAGLCGGAGPAVATQRETFQSRIGAHGGAHKLIGPSVPQTGRPRRVHWHWRTADGHERPPEYTYRYVCVMCIAARAFTLRCMMRRGQIPACACSLSAEFRIQNSEVPRLIPLRTIQNSSTVYTLY